MMPCTCAIVRMETVRCTQRVGVCVCVLSVWQCTLSLKVESMQLGVFFLSNLQRVNGEGASTSLAS